MNILDMYPANAARTRAFTLIELLIVIAILALLAAILMPVFGRVRENGRRSACQSNLKQIGLAITQYIQDYDERFPLALYGNLDNGTGWASGLQRYTRSYQVLQCPSDRFPPTLSRDETGYTDYWYNAALSWNGNTSAPNNKTSVRVSVLRFPTLSIMAGDGSGNSSHSLGSYRVNGCLLGGRLVSDGGNEADPGVTSCSTTGLATANGLGSATSRHLEGHNLLFTDGHVKYFKGVPGANSNTVATYKVYDVTTGFNTSDDNPTFNLSSMSNLP